MLQCYHTSKVAPFALPIPVFGLLSAQVVLRGHHTDMEEVAAMPIIGILAINVWAPLFEHAYKHWHLDCNVERSVIEAASLP